MSPFNHYYKNKNVQWTLFLIYGSWLICDGAVTVAVIHYGCGRTAKVIINSVWMVRTLIPNFSAKYTAVYF